MEKPQDVNDRYIIESEDSIMNLYPTPVYSTQIGDFDNVQKELFSALNEKAEFQMNPVWASHYLTDIFLKYFEFFHQNCHLLLVNSNF